MLKLLTFLFLNEPKYTLTKHKSGTRTNFHFYQKFSKYLLKTVPIKLALKSSLPLKAC